MAGTKEPRRHWPLLLAFAGAVLLAGVNPAGAQRLRGTVRDQASGLPLAQAVVTALSRGDSVLARALTNAQGQFSLALSPGEVARIRVVRIGYQPALSAVNGDESVAMVLQPLSWTLSAIQVSDRDNCPRRDDAARAMMLWSQAQAALLAGVVARESNPAEMRVVRFYRTIIIQASRTLVDTQSTRTTTEVGTRVFSAGQSPSYFAEHGYVVGNSDRFTIYGPDEDVLLDSSFARTHCFGLDHDSDHPGQIGIAFDPVRGRDSVTDLAGTLWVDSSRAALRTLQYHYTAIHIPNVNSQGAGGFMTFATAPNGIPFMVSWRVREGQRPLEAQFPRGTADGFGRGKGQLMRVNPELGAQVATATWNDGTVWTAPLPSTGGVVLDPAIHAPRVGLAIRLLNAGRLTRTDSLGHFQFDDLIAGPYLFAAEDTLFAVFWSVVHADKARIMGARPPPMNTGDWVKLEGGRFDSQPLVRPIQIDSGPNPSITVELPSIDNAFRRACGHDLMGDSNTVLAVWVLNGAAAADNATIIARWPDGANAVERPIRTDASGRAIVCGVPRGKAVDLFSTAGTGPPNKTTVQMLPDRLVTLSVIRLR